MGKEGRGVARYWGAECFHLTHGFFVVGKLAAVVFNLSFV